MSTLEQFIDTYSTQLDKEDTKTICEQASKGLSKEDLETLLEMLKDEGVNIFKHLDTQTYTTVVPFDIFTNMVDVEEELNDSILTEVSVDSIQQAPDFREVLKYLIDSGVNQLGAKIGPFCNWHQIFSVECESAKVHFYFLEPEKFIQLEITDAQGYVFQLNKPIPDELFIYYKNIGCAYDLMELVRFRDIFLSDFYNLIDNKFGK